MTKIKICGLSRMCDIEYVNEALPDYCGFIIDVPKSRRNVSPEQVGILSAGLKEQIIPVGVFVNAELEKILPLVRGNVIRAVQLHGAESDDMIRRVQREAKVPVIKAFSIKTEKDIQKANESVADYVLLDHGTGGTGVSFDWSLSSPMTRPYFLAGGIGLHNVKEALHTGTPWAVDISSGVESDGFKDKEKIMNIMEAVRSVSEE